MLCTLTAVERAGSGVTSASSCIVSVIGFMEGADSAHPDTKAIQEISAIPADPLFI